MNIPKVLRRASAAALPAPPAEPALTRSAIFEQINPSAAANAVNNNRFLGGGTEQSYENADVESPSDRSVDDRGIEKLRKLLLVVIILLVIVVLFILVVLLHVMKVLSSVNGLPRYNCSSS